MPRPLNMREIKKRLVEEYPIFVAGVLQQMEEEFEDDGQRFQDDGHRGRVTRPDDRRLKENRSPRYQDQ